MLWVLQEFPPPATLLHESLMILEICTRIFIVSSFSVFASFSCFFSLKLSSVVGSATSRELLTLIFWEYERTASSWKFPVRIFQKYDGQLCKPYEKSVSNALNIHEAMRYLRIVLLSSLCEEAYYCRFDTMINCEARNAERKDRTENNILEYKKKSTIRVHEAVLK